MGWVLLRRSELGCRSDQLASPSELLGTGGASVGEQAVVAEDEAGDEYEAEWTFAHDLIGCVVVATLGVVSFGRAAH
jgi:hypothetical protein